MRFQVCYGIMFTLFSGLVRLRLNERQSWKAANALQSCFEAEIHEASRKTLFPQLEDMFN